MKERANICVFKVIFKQKPKKKYKKTIFKVLLLAYEIFPTNRRPRTSRPYKKQAINELQHWLMSAHRFGEVKN